VHDIDFNAFSAACARVFPEAGARGPATAMIGLNERCAPLLRSTSQSVNVSPVNHDHRVKVTRLPVAGACRSEDELVGIALVTLRPRAGPRWSSAARCLEPGGR